MKGRTDISSLRREYSDRPLDHVPGPDADPFVRFGVWLDEAVAAGIYEPNAVVLSTRSARGDPASRTVLLKGFDRRGFVFYTNYGSRKGDEIRRDARVALLFYWPELHRQVRVAGRARTVTSRESDAYFATRPRGSRIGAWASSQSSVVEDRRALEDAFAEAEARFAGGEIPRPPNWGGYRVVPRELEFWQGRRSRMHDRLLYSRSGSAWSVSRLAP